MVVFGSSWNWLVVLLFLVILFVLFFSYALEIRSHSCLSSALFPADFAGNDKSRTEDPQTHCRNGVLVSYLFPLQRGSG